jgi:hypothetical protein
MSETSILIDFRTSRDQRKIAQLSIVMGGVRTWRNWMVSRTADGAVNRCRLQEFDCHPIGLIR